MKSTNKYNHLLVQSKWQKRWLEEKIYSPDFKKAEKPFYNLMMFPYPSAEGLHVGNMYAFTGADVYGRFNRMQGKDVFEPIGLDGFGIHSENYAIKVGRHPKEHAKVSEINYYKQLLNIGNSFAWDNRLETYDPDYYRWTQWLFIQMFKAGLAYKGEAVVNWCPTCKTVLADEQVIDGRCERTGDVVERKKMSSWYFRITNYADRLLDNIEKINWPEKIKIAQKQWIGKSRGLNIDFKVEKSEKTITVWTKYWETIYGVTFLVLAPEHPLITELKIPKKEKEEVNKYINLALSKSEQDRKAAAAKSGVFTGIYAINPVNGESVPIWVADYVLAGVGTSAVMGVPAHDQRDFEFAKKYGLKIVQVVQCYDAKVNNKVSKDEIAYEGEGTLLNSSNFDGLDSRKEGKEKISEWIIESGFGDWHTTYHLRDWLISRQRYWGPPIPLVYCQTCAEQNKGQKDDLPGWYSVPEAELPVILPDIADFKPKGDGTSPLANASLEWQTAKCPGCGGEAKRELDVSDTFLDSSWYFLRYPTLGLKNANEVPFDKGITTKWLPVNAYIGGAEHAVLHLLYARFVTMFLKDQGYLNFEEPFPFLFGHGLIIKDGAKMSKSKGNVVVPDEYIAKFGADTLRAYLMFLGPYDQGGDFRDTGMEGMHRFLLRLWELFNSKQLENKDNDVLTAKMHKTIKKVTKDISNFRYNTAIAAIMEYANALREHGASKDTLVVLAQLIAPFAPFMAEEVWVEVLGQPFSIHKSLWPSYNEKLTVEENISMVVQVNGKVRDTILLSLSDSQDKEMVKSASLKSEKVAKWVAIDQIKDTIFVPGRVINFVT